MIFAFHHTIDTARVFSDDPLTLTPILTVEAVSAEEARRAFVSRAWQADGFGAARLAATQWEPRAVATLYPRPHPRVARRTRARAMVSGEPSWSLPESARSGQISYTTYPNRVDVHFNTSAVGTTVGLGNGEIVTIPAGATGTFVAVPSPTPGRSHT